jgi:hypothetical protein
MSEVLAQLSSPAWWFSTILVALIVNLASNFLFEAIKKNGIKSFSPTVPQLNNTAWTGIAITYATLYLFSSAVAGIGAQGVPKEFGGVAWTIGTAISYVMVLKIPLWPAAWQFAVYFLTFGFVFALLSTPPKVDYHPASLPFAYFFVAAGMAFLFLSAAWDWKSIKESFEARKQRPIKRKKRSFRR